MEEEMNMAKSKQRGEFNPEYEVARRDLRAAWSELEAARLKYQTTYIAFVEKYPRAKVAAPTNDPTVPGKLIVG